MPNKGTQVLIIAALGIVGALIGAFVLDNSLITSGSLILAAIIIYPIEKQAKKEYDEEQERLKKENERLEREMNDNENS